MGKLIRSIAKLCVAYVVAFLLLWWLHPLILFRPTALNLHYTYTFPVPFREIFLNTSPDARINALLFFADSTSSRARNENRRTVLFFHGNRDNLVRWGREYSERFTKSGYNVLMYDYRGYGKSTGKRSEAALHEDARHLYRYLKARIPEDSIVVYGYSLGTGMASRVAAEHHPKLLILEAPYASIPVLGQTQLPVFPYEWLTRYKFRTDSCMVHIHCPVHLFHGTDDQTVPYANSLVLVKRPNASGQFPSLTTIEKGHHRHLDTFPVYRSALDSLLRKAAN